MLSESESGRLSGPWKTARTPFAGNGGHCMLFRTFDGRLAMALHQPEDARTERTKFFSVEDTGDALKVAGSARCEID